jgi:D-alanine--poly(phosphoribitol) ligase subunit 1
MILHDLIKSFQINANRNALCIKDEYFTFQDLSQKVAGLISVIESNQRMNNSSKIALVCSDSIYTYASILALWFLKKAYVPLGMHNPVERNLSILTSAEIDCILSSELLLDDRYHSYEIVNPKSMAVSNFDTLEFGKREADLAYILFTSGSTGIPKGVPISFRNLTAFINAFQSSPFTISENDRCLQMFELTFDVSISSFLIPLLKGACVFTVPTDVIKYIHVLKLIEKYRLTSIQIVPSVIKLAAPLLNRITFTSVKNCILTGEATSVDLLPIWSKCLPNAAIYNFYGPTEATIYCSRYLIDLNSVKSYNQLLAIGKPFAGISFLIVDENLKEVKKGEKGELLISGEQITNGYLNNEQKNSDLFLNMIVNGRQSIFYRSGDLCFQDESDDYYYCGRLDNQVKIQGFRVELSEIEMLIRSYFHLNNIAFVKPSKAGTNEIWQVIEGLSQIDEADIMNHCKSNLPTYMIPSKIIQMETFPLTSSGKTDRGKIKSLINDRFGA